MIYRTYPGTDLQVSAIGFGGMRFPDQDDVEACVDLTHYAYEKGINYFDTAPGYGKSEDLLGEAFKEMKKTRAEKPWYVSTKTTSAKPEDVRRQLETSLERMGLDSVDFYHVWYLLSYEEYERRKAEGVLKIFEKLKEEGLIRHIVVSTHMGGEDIEKLVNDYPFEHVLLGYSAMNFVYRDQGLSAARQLGRGTVVMNPLGGGIIPQHPERFGFLKTQENETSVQAALRFLINDPRITITLVGFSERAHVDEAVAAANGFQPISEEAIQEIRGRIQDDFNNLCTSCGYCLPCPKNIPVHQLMDTYNYYLLTDSAQQAMGRLRWHWGIKHEDHIHDACIQCGACEKRCTQKLDIMQRIEVLKGLVKDAAKDGAV